MIPLDYAEDWDPDSNGEVDVTCIDGTFEFPNSGTPPDCVDSSPNNRPLLCNSRPVPPSDTKLEQIGDKIKYRPGEKAYYVCENSEAIIKPNGTNMFDIACQEGVYNFDNDLANNVGWPTCVLEPICDNLPEPPAESLMTKATKGTSVRLGEHVVYECTKKDEYWYTPQDVRSLFFQIPFIFLLNAKIYRFVL